MLSLRTIDAEFVGCDGSWTQVCEGLFDENLISISDLECAKILQLFGRLINNTDMHLGNLSVQISGNSFSLLPAYDMCSMGFAPKGTQVTPFAFNLPGRNTVTDTTESTSEQNQVVDAAITFWQRVCDDDRASTELREFIREKRFVDELQDSLK